MFDSVLNMPLISMHFVLTRRINSFPVFIFGTSGANVSIAMFLESHLSFNDSEAVSYKHVTYIKKTCIIHEKNFPMFRKIRLKKVFPSTDVLEAN